MLGLNPGPLQLVHWQSDALTTRLDLIRTRLYLIRTRLDLIGVWSHPRTITCTYNMLRKRNYFCCRCLAPIHTHRLLTNTKMLPRRRKTKREECVPAIMAVSVDMACGWINEACCCDDNKKSWFLSLFVFHDYVITWRWQFRRREEVPHSSTLSHSRCFKMSSLIFSKTSSKMFCTSWTFHLVSYICLRISLIFIFSSNHSKL